MNKREALILKYKSDLIEKCGIEPNIDLLTKIAIGLGPSIYKADAATVSSSDEKERNTIKNNFLIKKLGLSETEDLDGALKKVIEKYGVTNRNKYRVVVYYLLVEHFGKQSVY